MIYYVKLSLMTDLITQSSDSLYCISQNRAKMSLQTQTPPPKLFTLYERLTIIEELIQQLRPDNMLKVLVNDDPMLPYAENAKQQNIVYTYQLAGSKNLKRTQNNNLFQKLDLMHKNQLQKTPNNKIQDPQFMPPQKQENSPKNPSKPTEDNQKAIFRQFCLKQRYFSENVKCFRCKRIGHHDFACLDQFSCFFCLSSEHHSQKCPQRFICFKCSHFGHVLNDCPNRDEAMICNNCKRRHYDKCGFLLKGTEHVKQVMVMDAFYFSEDIRCLKCFKYGHYNCEAIEGLAGNAPFKRPYQAFNERRQPREKYFNPNKKQKY